MVSEQRTVEERGRVEGRRVWRKKGRVNLNKYRESGGKTLKNY